jgi:hypothetical protein
VETKGFCLFSTHSFFLTTFLLITGIKIGVLIRNDRGIAANKEDDQKSRLEKEYNRKSKVSVEMTN